MSVKHNVINILLAVFFSSCIGKKDEEVVREYYDNGAIKAEYQTIDSVRNGVTKIYFPDGKIKFELTYKNDLLNGSTVQFYSNGNPKKKGSYVNGKIYGEAFEYFENGNIASRGSFFNDLKIGEWSYFFEEKDKQIKSINEYVVIGKTSRLNSFQEFDIDGKPIKQSTKLKLIEFDGYIAVHVEENVFDSVRAVICNYDIFFSAREPKKCDTLPSPNGMTIKVPYMKGDTVRGYVENYKLLPDRQTAIAKQIWFSYPDQSQVLIDLMDSN